jgi:hypothetical protein
LHIRAQTVGKVAVPFTVLCLKIYLSVKVMRIGTTTLGI